MLDPFQRRRDRRRQRDQKPVFAGADRRHQESTNARRKPGRGQNPIWRRRMGLDGAATAKLGEFWPGR